MTQYSVRFWVTETGFYLLPGVAMCFGRYADDPHGCHYLGLQASLFIRGEIKLLNPQNINVYRVFV